MPARIKSIRELRRELQAKQKRLDRLEARRKKIAARLVKVDRQIAVLAGVEKLGRGFAAAALVPAGKLLGMVRRRGKALRKAVRRAKARAGRARGKPLVEYIQEVLAKAAGGLRVKETVQQVRKAGYKTYSKDFYGIVATALRDRKLFKRIRRGVYAKV